MQPLGFYGLNLGEEIQIAIDGLHLHELTDLIDDMVTSLNSTYYFDNEEAPEIIQENKPVHPYQLSDAEKIALIRGLCDRIETKLMEITT